MDDQLMEKHPQEKSKIRHPDRVTLPPELISKLDAWMKHITDRHRGVRLTRNNMIEWLISSYPNELPSADIKTIAEQFYDEERFLKDAIHELRLKKARGENVSLAEILAKGGPQKTPNPKRTTKPKVAAKVATTANGPEAIA
ncbi:MAG: hypothetical protein WCI18_02825 [Pseudomonadota bacterium]